MPIAQRHFDWRKKELATRAEHFLRLRPDDTQWLIADEPPPRKRHFCGACTETIPPGTRCLDIGEIQLGRVPPMDFMSRKCCATCAEERIYDDGRREGTELDLSDWWRWQRM